MCTTRLLPACRSIPCTGGQGWTLTPLPHSGGYSPSSPCEQTHTCENITFPRAVKPQECIPVGCVLPAAVVVCWWGVYLSACWDTLPRCGPEDPSPGCGPGNRPQAPTPQLLPWVWAWRPARHAGIPPPTPWTE